MCLFCSSIRSIMTLVLLGICSSLAFFARSNGGSSHRDNIVEVERGARMPVSAEYMKLQQRLAAGWNGAQ